jgi:hypothetical protein
LDKLKEVGLEASFTTTPLLIHANPSKSFVLETNVFNFALGTCFHNLKIMIFFILLVSILISFFLAKINYKIHVLKKFAIINAFEKWCHLLEGAQDEILVYSYHKNF